MTLRFRPKPNTPPIAARYLFDEVPTPSSYLASWSKALWSSAWNIRQTLVFCALAELLPVPSERTTSLFMAAFVLSEAQLRGIGARARIIPQGTLAAKNQQY